MRRRSQRSKRTVRSAGMMRGATRRVIGGVDTHKDVHVAAVLDELGRLLDTATFAIKARTAAANQLHSLTDTAPDELRAKLRNLTTLQRVRLCARLRPGDVLTPAGAAKRS